MQFLDYLILAVILVLAVFAIRYTVKHKHKCCGNCSGCTGCSGCSGCKYAAAQKHEKNTGKE